MRDSQAVVAFARTERPDVFRGCWLERGRLVNDLRSPTSTTSWPACRRLRRLATRRTRPLQDSPVAARRARRPAGRLSPGRRRGVGALDRSEPYWRWLVSRKAHDELIVAIHGKDDWEELESPAHIVGYAVTRGSQVVELCTLPGFARAARPLLARACQDAIEQDHRSLSLHIPVTDPLHELLLAAGGSWSDNGRSGGGTLLVKLLDPARWIEGMYAVLLERAKRGRRFSAVQHRLRHRSTKVPPRTHRAAAAT